MGTKLKTVSFSSWDRKSLLALLDAIQERKVLVVGDVGVDRYTTGTVERISPEAPVPIVQVDEERLKLGLAANVADNMKRLGGAPLLLGAVGKDRFAEDFHGLLEESGVDPKNVIKDRSRRTVLKERIVSERQQLLRVDYENLHPIDAKMEAQVLEKAERLLGESDCVVIEDYAKGLLTPTLTQKIIKSAKAAGKKSLVDPNSKTPLAVYRGASVFTPNRKEAEELTQTKLLDDARLVEVGRQMAEQIQAEHVVITLGKDGMAVFSQNEEPYRVPTYAREVYDVSGAGDTVIAMFALALGAGGSVKDSVALANLAAGIVVGKRGTATVTPEEVRRAMEHPGP